MFWSRKDYASFAPNVAFDSDRKSLEEKYDARSRGRTIPFIDDGFLAPVSGPCVNVITAEGQSVILRVWSADRSGGHSIFSVCHGVVREKLDAAAADAVNQLARR